MVQSAGTIEISFTCPEEARIGASPFRPAFEAAINDDRAGLAALRPHFAGGTAAFDRFTRGMQLLKGGRFAAAAHEFEAIGEAEWRTASLVLRSIALACAGPVSEGLALANRTYDIAVDRAERGNPNRSGNLALVVEVLRCFARIDAKPPADHEPVEMAAPFRYLISYPRSGSTLLRRFLGFAFSAPIYSVYPGDGRYFSRTHYDRNTDHPIIVKEHAWSDLYFKDKTISVIRDGRDAMVSFARFQYANGHHDFVKSGQLSDFLRLCADSEGIGFWGDHVRTIMDAMARGADIRLLRYETLFRNYPAMIALAREIGGATLPPRDDEAAYDAFMNERVPDHERAPGWRENIALPADSYLPQRWSAGGGTIDWRAAFDARARRTFHELGGTELLLQLGYETDPDWWRHA